MDSTDLAYQTESSHCYSNDGGSQGGLDKKISEVPGGCALQLAIILGAH